MCVGNYEASAPELHVEAHLIYPETKNTFWSLVIGLGYPTPEAPGFRWCTERLKINPSNAFTYNTIKKDGEIVILLGVRKAESSARSRSISSREIEGKILTRHDQIPKAYVYCFSLPSMQRQSQLDLYTIVHRQSFVQAFHSANAFLQPRLIDGHNVLAQCHAGRSQESTADYRMGRDIHAAQIRR